MTREVRLSCAKGGVQEPRLVLGSKRRRRAEARIKAWRAVVRKSRTENGTSLKWLSTIDEFTRECLTLTASRSITSEDVIDALSELFKRRGAPGANRSDNGPEFIARAIQDWLKRLEIDARYIAPGSPWEARAAAERSARMQAWPAVARTRGSFHSKVVDEFLNVERFESMDHARAICLRRME